MTLAQLKNLVQYVTDADGNQASVIVPTEIWREILNTLQLTESSLYPEDEDEPKQQILADLQEAIRLTQKGETFPVSQLWSKVYE